MDKLKNLIHPGKSKDDEVMYGTGQSSDPVHTGTGIQATSSHNPNDPMSSSTGPTASSTREPIGQGGTGSIQQGSIPLSSSRTPGTFVDDGGSAMSIKSGHQGNSQESKETGTSDTHDPLDTNKPLPREPTTAHTGAPGSSTISGVGPHSSSMANKADPRVDSDLDGSRGLGGRDTSGITGGAMGSTLPDRTAGNTVSTYDTGRSFPLGGVTSGTATSGPHSSNLANKTDPRVDDDRDGSRGVGGTSGFGSGTSATSGSAHKGDLSRSGLGGSSDANTGVATGAATGVPLPRGYGEESWTHDHNHHGHEYAGDPCANEPPAPGAVHFIPGPHSLDTTNRLDPHVGGGGVGGLEHATADSTSNTSDRQSGSGPLGSGVGMGTSGVGAYDSTRGPSSTSAFSSFNAAPGAGTYDSNRDTPSTSATQQPRTSAYQPSHTAGGAGTYDSNRDTPSTSAIQQPGTSGYQPSNTADGAESYDSSRNTPSSSATQQSNTTAGPHKSNLFNKMDPRVDSDRSKQQETSTASGLGGSGSTSTIEPSADREHHHGRDATLAGAGAGLGGAAAYGAGQHSAHNVPEGTSGSGYSNPYPPTSSTAGTNLGSSAREPTGSGLASSTSGPMSTSGPTSSSNLGSSTREPTGSGLGYSTTGPTSSTGPSSHSNLGSSVREPTNATGLSSGHAEPRAYEANKYLGGSHDDATTERSVDPSTTQQPLSGSSRPDYGRDAGLTGAGATGHHDPRHQPTTASGLSGQPTSAYDETQRTGESHTGRNAVLGAGAGAAAVAGGEELSRKELEREQKAAQKEELKQQEAAHKHDVKEEKHHQHELEKEEKKHEKALAAEKAKEEKHHQHELDKAKKEHEKALAKEEAKHHKEDSHEGEKEKKHHGLFGFLHRDKPDKELKEEEAARKEGLEHHDSEHDRNRLHKDPPPGYGETKYAEEPKSGYASQVRGGTGTTGLAQGDSVPQGSHATGLGNKADPNVSGRGDTIDSNRTRDSEGRVIEPTTGLPIDLSKGDGAGGTDGTPVHGYHGSSTTGGSSTGGGFGHLQDHS
ncbi:MAG: hypothetical protein Q9226_006216, partial [Calogaya cf. arnoldii]